MTTFGKEVSIRFTVCVFRERLSICVCIVSFCFEGGMWDLLYLFLITAFYLLCSYAVQVPHVSPHVLRG